jgi:hypothetical protein
MSAPAELLRAMADRIERNSEDEFAGCFVVIPPQSADGRGGDTVEMLLIDPTRDPSNFWTAAGFKLDTAVGRFKEINSTPQLGYR